MRKIIKVKPRKDLKVPYPESRRFLPAQGADVPRNRYWIKRLKDGDVEEVESAPKEEKKDDAKEVKTDEAPKKKTKKKTSKKNSTKNLEGER